MNKLRGKILNETSQESVKVGWGPYPTNNKHANEILNSEDFCETPKPSLQNDVRGGAWDAPYFNALCSKARRRTSSFFSHFPFSFSPNAFSLAEVLITLGIIGVVAAMTLPALINNIQDAQFKSAWKKEYSVINQAYEKMKYDNGNDLSGFFDRPTGNYFPEPFTDEFSTYFSTIKKCLMKTSDIWNICGTYSSIDETTYKTLSGGYILHQELVYGNFVLADGAHLFFRTYQQNKFIVWVDVNGFGKKPNTLGRDLYGLIMTKDKIIPLGANGSHLENTCNSTPVVSPGMLSGLHNIGDMAGAGCSAEVLYK